MSCNVTRSSSHPQSSDKTWIAPASHWILTLCPHQMKICTLHCCSKVCVLPLKTFHFGPASHQRIRCLSRLLLRHQTAGSQPGGSESPLSSGRRVALSWMDWAGYNVHICYIHICSYYVILEHTLCIVTVWYRCVCIYIYMYTYIYTYYNMYGECKYIYILYYIL